MWNQHSNSQLTERGLVFDADNAVLAGALAELPKLPSLVAGGGFTLDMWIFVGSREPGGTLLDTRGQENKGLAVTLTERGTVRLTLNDGRSESSWESDEGLLRLNAWQHMTIIVDGGPKLITFVINGELCDGGRQRQFGWGRFSPYLQDVNGSSRALIGSGWGGVIGRLRIYDRYLLNSEAVGNYRAGVSL
jgi:hypothetical protein